MMGLAIIMVMMFHTVGRVNNELFSYIFSNGDFGVDLFAIISGIGIVQALKKHADLKIYYQRRLLRILPAYFIAVLPVALYRHFVHGATYGQMLTLLSAMGIFRGLIAYWYISYILLCYLFAPLLYRLQRMIKTPLLFTLIGWIVALCIQWYIKDKGLASDAWVFRIPLFFLGMECSELCCRKNEANNGTERNALLYLAIAIGFYLIIGQCCGNVDLPIRYTCYFLMAPICLWSLANFMDRTPFVQPLLRHFGKYTLELYLVHEWICLPIVFGCIGNVYVSAVLAFLLAYILARFVSCLSKRIVTTFAPHVF